jgi:hypothetical protein|nr:MAG TPA: hypothetical protein [Caudoviricetes sp.]
MGYEITKFNFQDDLASANFNAKFQEIETYLNNIEEELKTVKEENTKLKEKLDNKVEKNVIGLEKINDALTVDRSGLFWCADSANTPEPHGLLIVGIPWTNDLGFKSLSFISCNNGKMYTRYKFLGNWSPNWIEK